MNEEFEAWWEKESIDMLKLPIKEVAEIAWKNGEFKKEEEQEKEYWVPKFKSCYIHGEFRVPGYTDWEEGILTFFNKGVFTERDGGKYAEFRAPIQTPENCTVKIGSLCQFWDKNSSVKAVGYFCGIHERDRSYFMYSATYLQGDTQYEFINMRPLIETDEYGRNWDYETA